MQMAKDWSWLEQDINEQRILISLKINIWHNNSLRSRNIFGMCSNSMFSQSRVNSYREFFLKS